MAGRRLLNLVVVVALVVGAAACKRGSGSEGGGDTTLPTVVETVPTTPTSTTPAVPSYEVPEVIDAAYVESVMKALDHVYGDAIRIMARDRALTEDFLRHLGAIYTDRFLNLALESWSQDVSNGLRDLPVNPGDPQTAVQRIVEASAACTVVEVRRDFSGFSTAPLPSRPQRFVAMIQKPRGRDALGVNPTPWIMTYDGFTQDGSVPDSPCRPV